MDERISIPVPADLAAWLNRGRAVWPFKPIPIMFEHSRHDERNSCILWG
jgi:hypothetical protein